MNSHNLWQGSILHAVFHTKQHMATQRDKTAASIWLGTATNYQWNAFLITSQLEIGLILEFEMGKPNISKIRDSWQSINKPYNVHHLWTKISVIISIKLPMIKLATSCVEIAWFNMKSPIYLNKKYVGISKGYGILTQTISIYLLNKE